MSVDLLLNLNRWIWPTWCWLYLQMVKERDERGRVKGIKLRLMFGKKSDRGVSRRPQWERYAYRFGLEVVT